MKVINIVYDDWTDEIPNINGIKHGSFLNYNVVDHIKYPNSLYINRHRLSDVKNYPNRIFNYFIINMPAITKKILLNNENIVYDEVIEYWRECSNLNIIFLNDQESLEFETVQKIDNWTEKLNLNKKQLWIINNNKRLLEYKEKLNTDINFVVTNSLAFWLKCNEFTMSDYTINKNGSFFICHNRKYREYRILLIMLLRNNKVLDNVDWSLIENNKDRNNNFFKNFFTKPELLKYSSDINFINNIDIKKSIYEKNHKNDEIYLTQPLSVLESFKNSYVNIATETLFFTDEIHITEKSFKPFYYFQFPLISATQHHIKYMKEIYNLDFYDDIINHDYDNEPDYKKRIYKLVNEIKRINSNKQLFIDFYENNKDRFINNYNKILDLINHEDQYRISELFINEEKITKKNNKQMKGLLFTGCSFTWGQGLYYYSNLDTLREPLPNQYDDKLVTDAHRRYMATLRYPRLVANHFNTFEVTKPFNSGSEDDSINFINELFGIKEGYNTEKYSFSEIEYIIIQTSQLFRNMFKFELNGNLHEFSVFRNETKKNFYEWLVEVRKITFNDWVKEFTKTTLDRLKELMTFYESKGIKTKILCWSNEYLDAIKSDTFMSDRFIPLIYEDKTYDCIADLMSRNKCFTINNDYDHFIVPPQDHHPSLKCHQIMANSVIKKIEEDNIQVSTEKIKNITKNDDRKLI